MPEFLTHKYAKLPAWAWLAIFAGTAFVYFRVRSGGTKGTADTTSTDGQSGSDQVAGAEGAAQGFVQGYNTGFGQGVVNSTPPVAVPSGSQDCRSARDPAGRTHTVCGHGFWVKAPGGTYRWVQGTKPVTPIRVVKAPKGVRRHPPAGSKARAA